MISVIIPCFNMQDYLADAIESVLAQQTKAEIIVIDDGSTDNSLAIARQYPIKVISQVNKGLASARNTGIMNATGDWILPLDADDGLNSNCIRLITERIRKTNVDIIGLSFCTFGTSKELIILQDDATIEDFKTGNRLGYCSAIKKSALIEIGGYNPKMTWGWEDLDLWFDLLKRGKKVSVIKEPVWLYRTKDTSMWTESVKHSDELWGQIKKNHPELFLTVDNPVD